MEESERGHKGEKSPKQSLTSAKDLTMEIPEGSILTASLVTILTKRFLNVNMLYYATQTVRVRY